MAVPITHDNSAGDGHAGSPATQYDLVLMAGNPSYKFLFRAQAFPLRCLALFGTV